MPRMIQTLRTLFIVALLGGAPFVANAQGTNVDFGGLKTDTSLPVEIQADQLSVDQADGLAVFSGNVLVSQGEMRLSAGEVRVEYSTDGKGISRLIASGGVIVRAGTDAAEADEAIYTIATGELLMQGKVLLTQGQAAISGDMLVLNLETGKGTMTGRVTTTFIPGGN